MTVQCVNKIPNQRVDLSSSVREFIRLEGVIESPPINKQALLSKNLFENVSLHFLTLLAHVVELLSYSPSEWLNSQRGLTANKLQIISLSEE
jgi:hypothetical protein